VTDKRYKVLVVSLWNRINFKNNASTQFLKQQYIITKMPTICLPTLKAIISCFSGFPCMLESVIISATSTVILISQFLDRILFFSGINNSLIYTIIITITTTKNYWTFSGVIQTHHTFFHNSNKYSPYSDKIQEGWYALYMQHAWVIQEMRGKLTE
jgi:hypothetical protein